MELKNSSEVKKAIVDELKKEGVDVTEEAVSSLVKATFRIIPKLSGLISNSTAKMVYSIVTGPVIALEPQVLAWVDKIDGEDDPER